jgi:hypothetical protein
MAPFKKASPQGNPRKNPNRWKFALPQPSMMTMARTEPNEPAILAHFVQGKLICQTEGWIEWTMPALGTLTGRPVLQARRANSADLHRREMFSGEVIP